MNVRPARAARVLLQTLVLGLASPLNVACSSTTSSAAPDAAPAPPVSCDAGVPSYQTEIEPILREACLPCHGPAGSAGFDESTYAEVSSQAGTMLTMVVQGGMPPVNGPQLTSAQRAALTDWLECGAPDN
jgi:mono/diheme cytochrome c family protein